MLKGFCILILMSMVFLQSGCATTGLTENASEPTSASPSSEPTSTTSTPEQNTINVASVMQQADFAYAKGDLKAAEQGYMLAIKHSSDNANAQYRLANTLVRQKRYDDAITVYKASLTKDGGQMQTYNNLAILYMYQAQAVLSSGVDHLSADDGNTAQIKHMLWQLKNITPEKLQDIESKLQ